MALYRPSPSVYVPPVTPPITGSLTTLAPVTSTTIISPSFPTTSSIISSPSPPLPAPFASPSVAPEVVEEALTLEGSALLALCVAGSPLCGNEDFWRRKFVLDFPGVSFQTPGRTWRQRYEILYQQTRLFPIRRVEQEALNSLNSSIFGRIPAATVVAPLLWLSSDPQVTSSATETNPGTGERSVVAPFRKWYQLLNEGVYRGQLDRDPVSMWLNGIPVLLSPSLQITQREGLGFLEDLHRQQVYPSYPAAALDNAGLPEIDLGGGSIMYSEDLFSRIFGAFSERERRAWDQYSYQVAYVARYADLYDRLPPQALHREALSVQAPVLFEALQNQIKVDPRFNPVANLVRESRVTGLEGATVRQLVTEYSQLPGGVAQHARFLADALLVDFRLSDKIIVPYPTGCIPTSLGYPETSIQCIPIGDYQNPEWLLEQVTLLVSPTRSVPFDSRSQTQTTFPSLPSTQTTFPPLPTITRTPAPRPSTILVSPPPLPSPPPIIASPAPSMIRTYAPVVTGIEQEIPLPIENL